MLSATLINLSLREEPLRARYSLLELHEGQCEPCLLEFEGSQQWHQ